MRPTLLIPALLLSSALVGGEAKLALVGPLPDEKVAETLVGQDAVDAANVLPEGPRLKLAVFGTGAADDNALAAAKRAAADADVVAVVVHGEGGVAPEVLEVYRQAGLAVVAASSWARTRTAEAATTWLCPAVDDLAESAAVYARRQDRATQVAVVDDGSPTSTAAAHAFAARFRALGGKVPLEATWRGDAEGLSQTVRSLAAHWPQRVFYAGAAATAGRLVVAMKAEKALKAADLIGLPPLFDPAFFNATRVKGLRTVALFPCPDYDGMGALVRQLGIAFPRTSPEYRSYLHYANRRPGRWTSMIYDGVALAARAVKAAAKPAVAAGAVSATASVLTPAAEAEAVAPQATVTREQVRLALLAIDGYRGIRGVVKFGPTREPAEPRAMVYFALNRVNKKEMLWKQKAFGPPF